MPQDGGGGSIAGNELAAISVPVMPERTGQLMRQALQRRLEGSSTGVAKKYELTASPAISVDSIGIQRDSSSSRTRVNGSVTWYLRRLDVAHTLLATGSGRILDGYNIINQQFFAADLETETVFKRVVEALADQVTMQVAIYLQRTAASEAAGKAPAAGPVVVTAPSAPIPPQVPVDLLTQPPTDQF
jgi:LPS-assembly lipoprotein